MLDASRLDDDRSCLNVAWRLGPEAKHKELERHGYVHLQSRILSKGAHEGAKLSKLILQLRLSLARHAKLLL